MGINTIQVFEQVSGKVTTGPHRVSPNIPALIRNLSGEIRKVSNGGALIRDDADIDFIVPGLLYQNRNSLTGMTPAIWSTGGYDATQQRGLCQIPANADGTLIARSFMVNYLRQDMKVFSHSHQTLVEASDGMLIAFGVKEKDDIVIAVAQIERKTPHPNDKELCYIQCHLKSLTVSDWSGALKTIVYGKDDVDNLAWLIDRAILQVSTKGNMHSYTVANVKNSRDDSGLLNNEAIIEQLGHTARTGADPRNFETVLGKAILDVMYRPSEIFVVNVQGVRMIRDVSYDKASDSIELTMAVIDDTDGSKEEPGTPKIAKVVTTSLSKEDYEENLLGCGLPKFLNLVGYNLTITPDWESFLTTNRLASGNTKTDLIQYRGYPPVRTDGLI